MISRNFLGGEDQGPLLVFLHGGGYSGLTWAPLSDELTRLVECHTLALDLRGHGCSKTEDEYDLSAEKMAEDISKAVEKYIETLNYQPEVVLIGKSSKNSVKSYVYVISCLFTF